MTATTKLGWKQVQVARMLLPELGVACPVSFELVDNDSNFPTSGRLRAAASESGRS